MLSSVVRWVAGPLMALAFSSLILAQNTAPSGTPATDPPVPTHDMSGVWGINRALRGTGASAMTPPAQALYDQRAASLRASANEDADVGKTSSVDPLYHCFPPGVPRIYSFGVWPFEIVQTPNRLFFFYENLHMYRTIWMDGRKVPSDSDPEVDASYLGYSVGHWDGKDLVVETTHFNDKTWLDQAGHPHSDALRVTERFRRADYKDMTLEVTIDDAKSYTKPWTITASYKLQSGWELGEAFCVPQEPIKGFKETVPDPSVH